jgi:hypothetical protein
MARSRCPNLPHPVRVRPRQVHPPQGLRLFHATLGRGHLHGPMNAVDLTVQTRTEVAHLAPGALLSGGAGGFRGRNKRWGRGGRAVTQRRPASAGWSGGRLGATTGWLVDGGPPNVTSGANQPGRYSLNPQGAFSPSGTRMMSRMSTGCFGGPHGGCTYVPHPARVGMEHSWG